MTASEERTIRAFDLDVVDYLVKPVDIDRFDRAMRRLLETLGSPSRAPDAGAIAAADAALRAAPQALRGDVPSPVSDAVRGGAVHARTEGEVAKRFTIRDARGMYFVDVADVERIEADGNYVALIAAGRRHLVCESMHALESRLDPAEFARASLACGAHQSDSPAGTMSPRRVRNHVGRRRATYLE